MSLVTKPLTAEELPIATKKPSAQAAEVNRIVTEFVASDSAGLAVEPNGDGTIRGLLIQFGRAVKSNDLAASVEVVRDGERIVLRRKA